MPKCGSIGYELATETKSETFLQENQISDLENSLSSGSIANVQSELEGKIEAEMQSGLSLESLNIEGRAPLNEIAQELVARIKVSLTDIEVLSKLVRSEGNTHRKEEAEELFRNCNKEYQKKQSELKTAVENYNNDREHKVKNGKDEDGNPKYTIEYYGRCAVNYSEDGKKSISWDERPDPNHPQSGEVTKKFNEAKEHWDKYETHAVDLLSECQKLTVAGGASKVSGDDKGKLPDGVQEGARVEVERDSIGITVTKYTNPDGSTVKIVETKEGQKSHEVFNRYGYKTESIIYNDKGEIDHKNVYKYNKVDGKKNVYQVTQEQYKYDGNKYSEKPDFTDESYGYAYRGKESGTIEYHKKEPDQSQVAVSSTSVTSGTQSEDSSGKDSTTKISTAGYVTPKNFNEAKEAMKNKQNFVLTKGGKIVEDQPGIQNAKFSAEDEDLYFSYDEKDKKYYATDKDGNVKTRMNYDYYASYKNDKNSFDAKETAKMERYYIDPENFTRGNNKTFLKSTMVDGSNNSRFRAGDTISNSTDSSEIESTTTDNQVAE